MIINALCCFVASNRVCNNIRRLTAKLWFVVMIFVFFFISSLVLFSVVCLSSVFNTSSSNFVKISKTMLSASLVTFVRRSVSQLASQNNSSRPTRLPRCQLANSFQSICKHTSVLGVDFKASSRPLDQPTGQPVYCYCKQ